MKGTKRLAAAITTLFAAGALALSASAAAAHNYKGDINRDDKVNITDLVCLNKHFQGVSYIPEENIVYADMDGNGRLNVIDFMFLKIAALSDAEPEEIEITAPAETTPAVTTKTTAAATTAVTTKTTAASAEATTTPKTTSATAATTSTTKAAAVTTTTTASSTNKASSATTTTTTTSTTTASSAATTTTTTITTKATSATTTTTTTTAPSVIGNGVNTVAATDKARGFVVFQGDAETYDFVKDASKYIPGSVYMPEISQDGTYTSKYRFIDPPVTNFYAFLSILQPNSYRTYGSDSGITVEIKSAKVDGVTVDVSGLTQESDGAKVNISDILTNSHELEITYEVKGINGSGSSGSSGSSSGSGSSTPSGKVLAGTDVNRAVLAFGDVITDTTAFTNNDDFTTTNMPEITGNGTYTASFTSDSGIDVYYMGIQLMKGGSSDNKAFYQAYPNVKINVSSVKVNGIEKKGSKKLYWDGTETDTVINFEQRPYEAYVNIFGDNLTQMTGNSVKSVEVTFTVSGM